MTDPSNISFLADRIALASKTFTLAIIDVMPAIIFSALLPIVVFFFANLSEKSKRLALVEMTFFSLLGALVAYLTYLSLDTVLKNVLPSVIVILTFFFQLFGRTKTDSQIPLGTRITFLSGTISILTFIISSRYFNILFGAGAV